MVPRDRILGPNFPTFNLRIHVINTYTLKNKKNTSIWADTKMITDNLKMNT